MSINVYKKYYKINYNIIFVKKLNSIKVNLLKRKGNEMKKSVKMKYAPPVVEVFKVVLDGVIASSVSPIRHIDLQGWDYDDNLKDPQNNADIWLNF